MLVVTVELHPGGNAFNAKELGRMVIGNISSLADLSHYRVLAKEGENPLTNSPAKRSDFLIEDHKRKQSVWALIEKAARMTNADFAT